MSKKHDRAIEAALSGYKIEEMKTPDDILIVGVDDLEVLQTLIFKAQTVITDIEQELDDSWADHTNGVKAAADWIVSKRFDLREWKLALSAMFLHGKALKKQKAQCRKDDLITYLLDVMPDEHRSEALEKWREIRAGAA